jgi:hypothetical protein
MRQEQESGNRPRFRGTLGQNKKPTDSADCTARPAAATKVNGHKKQSRERKRADI